ncbi:MAG: rod shape-determining protein MreC [Candidatus Koribacter versatilis]|uniref:Cell shape-determining protein MreC n=1 Tax=Candidatus Korobacter versatilis TaxID=658062 RepID=A0A932EPV3_9BACT|nr:rod shape-determining protein MreC [Candidatus Koribacter versatilis]
MENLFVRHRNATLLVALLFAQILGLAMQVKRADPNQPDHKAPLLRVWVMSVITPVEKLVVSSGHGIRDTWNDYVNLRGVRKENRDLKAQLERMRIEQIRLQEDAEQGRRLQAVLHFKEQFISQTVAAQVIGSSGSEQSRVIYIDKGANDGLAQDMPVITPDGVVGKIVRVLSSTSQVLLITDPAWGVGGVLEKSRLQGIAKGTPSGDLKFSNILADEKVEPGERVLTSGGDRIFPKGLPLATVSELLKREDMFLNIRLVPATNLNRLEEVLVITKVEEREPSADETANGPVRAADVLAQRLPSVKKPETPQSGSPAAVKPANPQQQQKVQPKPAETRPEAPATGDNPR